MAEKSPKKHYVGYSIQKRGKSSYWIRISHKGKQYNHTFHAPENLSESKQYALAEKEAIKIKDKINQGYSTTMPIFKDYIQYILKTKEELSIKRSTLNEYKYISVRLINEFGEDPLDNITPYKLNQFYIKLQNSYTNVPASAITINNKLRTLLKEKGVTQQNIKDGTTLGINTIAAAINGIKVSLQTAEKICAYIDINIEDYFYIISNSKKISSKTVNQHIILLNTVFKTAVRERILEHNPMDATIKPKITNTSEANYYQPEEVAEILEKLSKEDLRWQVIISLLIVTGCRRGEIAGLQWNNVIWDYNLLRINHEVLIDDNGIYTEDNLKNMQEKYVQVDQETMNLLHQYHNEHLKLMAELHIEENNYPKYCFYQLNKPEMPMHPSSINQFLKRFSSKYGFRKINPHAFRHSLASALIADGVDIYAISQQLGHKQVATTREIYAHQINKHQAEIAERIPNIYRKNK